MKKNSINKTNKKWNTLLASTALVAAGIAFLSTNPALAEVGATELPTGGTVAEGSASFSNPDASTLQINQSSDRVVIDWNSFNIGTDATTEFVQPGSGSLAVNRIHDADASQILGTLKANGQIMLLNSNGVLFGENATIDVGAIIASTGELTNTAAVMNGADPVLSNFGDAGVINNATITIADAGLAAFVAPTVVNNGIIIAKTGRIGLAGANGNTTVTVDLYGDGLFELAAGTQSGSVSVDNQGTASAEGGQILLTAATAKNIVDGVINTDGILDVQSVTVEGGKIILSAGENGDVTATGTMDASGTNGGLVDLYGQNIDVNAEISADGGMGDDGNGNGGDVYIIGENTAVVRGTITAKGGTNGGDGGFVETSGYQTIDFGGTTVNTSAAQGNNGLWLIDPVTLTVDQTMADSLSTSSTDILLETTDGLTFAADINLVTSNVSLTATAGGSGINMANNYIRTNGGDVTFYTTGAIDLNKATIFTRGGDVDLTGDSISINNNSAIGTSGGDVDFLATSTSGGDTISINNSAVDTTGGDSLGSLVLWQNGSLMDQNDLGNVHNEFKNDLNGGTITFTGKKLAANSTCFAFGGAGCSVADPIEIIELIVTIMDWEKIYGEDDPLLDDSFWELTTGTLNGGDTLTVDLTRDTGEDVGTYNIYQSSYTLTNADSYSITFVNGDFTITPADLTVTATGDSKTYDGLAYTDGNGVTYDGFAFDDDATDLGGLLTYGGDSQGAIDAGTYTITADGLTSGNYNISYENGTLTVDKAMLTVTADDQTMTYGGSLPTLTAAYTGFVNGEDQGDLTTLATVTSGTDATADAGTYTDTLIASGAAADNYDFTYVAGDLTIDKADLLVTANDDSKTYDGLAYTDGNGVTYNGFVNGDNAGDLGGLLTYGGDSQGAVDAGTYTITADGLTSGNYNIDYAEGTLTVGQASLTITADSFNKTYGDTYSFTGGEFTTDGLVNGETLTSATLASNGADATAVVNSYNITVSGATGGTANLNNYDVTYVGGTLTVDKAALTVTANSDSKTYGTTYSFDGSEFTTSGLVNDDDVTSVTLTSDGAVSTANVGNYDIDADSATGTGLENYDITYVTGNLEVTAADLLIVTANDATKTYGETFTFNGTEYTTSGLVNDDDVTSVTLISDGAGATANVGEYDIVISDATGTGLENYNISYENGTLTVDKAMLTVTADDQTMTYGGSLPTLTAAYTGFVNGEDQGDLTTLATVTSGTDATADAGTYTDTLTASGAAADNYDFTYVAGDLTIDKADLLVTANDDSKTYDGLAYTDGNGVTYNGFVNGDNAGDLGGLLTYGGDSQGAIDAGTYTITADGLTSGNYNIDYAEGTLTIGKAELLLTANDGSKTYGETYNFDGDEYAASGLVDGDVINSVTLATAGSDATANVGDYTITIGGATGDDLANYNVGYQNGTLTVNGAPLTITTDEQSKNFGEEDPELTFQITEGELLFEDVLSGELSREEGEAAGTYAILQNTLSAGANYTITYVGNVLTIWPLQPQPEADIAQEDIFNPEFNPEQENGVGLSVTVTGLPVLPGTSNAPSAFDLASIAPAAGGDEAQSAEDVAAIEPAAGNGEFAGCWDDVIFSAGNGVNTTYSFDYAPMDLLEDTANCGTTTVSE